MSPKEARRVYIMEQVLEGNLTIKQAAEMLQLSERQVKRLKKGMKEEGVVTLAHKPASGKDLRVRDGFRYFL